MLLTGIRSIINIKSQNFCDISQLVQNDKTVQNPKDIATIFNQYFVNIAGKIETGKFPLDYLGRKISSSFFLILTNSAEIASIGRSGPTTSTLVGPRFGHLRLKSYISRNLIGPTIVWSRLFSNNWTNFALLPPPLLYIPLAYHVTELKMLNQSVSPAFALLIN